MVRQSCRVLLFAFALAILLSEASVQVALAGEGRAAPSLAALSASSLPGTLRCPGTHRILTAPGRVCGSRGRSGHSCATLRNSSKTDCEEPVECARSRLATSRLSRKTQRSVASLAEGAWSAAFAPLSAAWASASKTSACRPRENDLRLICIPY